MGEHGELMPVSQARERLVSFFKPTEVEVIKLGQAAGRVLAEAVSAGHDLPPFTNSSMDGFAVRAQDVANAGRDHPVVLPVVTDISAGLNNQVALRPGQAARIMTGAPLPEGADAVVPVEDTDFNYRDPGKPAPDSVQIFSPVQSGDSIRPQGQDVQSGESVLEPGQLLRAQELGFLSMLGVPQIPVRRLPRVGVFSSGDELLPVEAPLTPGKIHDANTNILISLVKSAGAQALPLGVAPDRLDAVTSLLDHAAAQQVDLILSSAGVSVGAFDFVRSAVEENGSLDFWRVNMRPGKPLAFGHYRGIPFIGLPGNPVSAFVGFEVFVRPAIAAMMGIDDWQRPVVRAELQEAVESDGRESYLRAVLTRSESGWQARLTGHQGSGNLRSLVQANALILVPSGVKSLPIGTEVDAWFL